MPALNVDPEIIVRCQQGDPLAFDQLFRLLREPVFRWCFSLLRDHDDAEEVFQECIVRLFRHIGSLKDMARFPNWLYRMAVNQCNTHRARKGRQSHAPLLETIEVKPEDFVFRSAAPENPRQSLLRKETASIINAHIADLPAKQRIAVILFDVEGFSIREVAEQMACSEGAVKFNIHEGRRKLRETLRPFVKIAGGGHGVREPGKSKDGVE